MASSHISMKLAVSWDYWDLLGICGSLFSLSLFLDVPVRAALAQAKSAPNAARLSENATVRRHANAISPHDPWPRCNGDIPIFVYI